MTHFRQLTHLPHVHSLRIHFNETHTDPPFAVQKRKRKQKKAPKLPVASSSASKVDENVKKLLKLSSFKLNDKLVQSAFKRSASRHYTLPDKEKAPEQSTSIFSEEDFARFAAEYTI